MFSGLARAIESAIARTGGRELSRLLEDWWLPLIAALAVAVATFLLCRALKLRRGGTYALVSGVVVFAAMFAVGPISNAIEQASLSHRAEREIRAALIDPTTAQIDVALIRKFDNGDRTVCGWVNARARNGAYQGRQLFAVRWQAGQGEPRTNIDRPCRLSLGLEQRCETTIQDDARYVQFEGPARRYCPSNMPTYD